MLHLYRYYKKGTNPLKSISDMPDNDIITFMEKTYPKHTWFHSAPELRIKTRRDVESWLHGQFKAKGGTPKTKHPCYFSVGESLFLKNFESFEGESETLRVPLDHSPSDSISFTYPDSFFSLWLSNNKDHPLYNKDLNGRIFGIAELQALISESRIPSDVYMNTPNYQYHFYIEAQVWDFDLLKSFNAVRQPNRSNYF